MEIDEMQAGRELDALIDREVMELPTREAVVLDDDAVVHNRSPFTPAYSADIAAAWQIVEKLGNKIALQGPGTTDIDMGYAYYKTWTADFDGMSAQARTAPLAIYRAALKAVMK